MTTDRVAVAAESVAAIAEVAERSDSFPAVGYFHDRRWKSVQVTDLLDSSEIVAAAAACMAAVRCPHSHRRPGSRPPLLVADTALAAAAGRAGSFAKERIE